MRTLRSKSLTCGTLMDFGIFQQSNNNNNAHLVWFKKNIFYLYVATFRYIYPLNRQMIYEKIPSNAIKKSI